MGLFMRKKEEPEKQSLVITIDNDNTPRYGHKYVFQQANGFRGFKRFKLSGINKNEIQNGIDALKSPNPKFGKAPSAEKYIFKTKEEPIILQEMTYGHDMSTLRLLVFVNQHQVGILYIHEDDEKASHFYDALIHKRIEAVYIKIDCSSLGDNDCFQPYIMIKEKE